MAKTSIMRRLAKWHIWLGWLVGVPIVMWTATGLFMVAKPIEEVRGEHLRIESKDAALPPGNPAPIAFQLTGTPPVRSFETRMESGRAITRVTYMDGRIERFDAVSGDALDPLGEAEARELVASQIVGGDMVASVTAFDAENVPFDFRRPLPVWQVALEDGTHVYVGRDTGRIEAVRTRWWRWFDFMWGLHIMDLSEREDTSHPILIAFAALSLTGAIFGCILMFRRRKARAKTVSA
ncbi:Uncharacterized conserved secreted or membrane protein [Erythrobacter sp. NAP1]|uniref:PepSY domain-containing protein n=1 Tax=Erythrobacter sp. NAP1 TaxID=237727 RepID=UPI0000686D33|nr:PepSY domain-containing protein [Erythrobacter sp. NAP1]EAQ30560.1 Uncharacterized conserved secreted or membrane protein [Erythrobacter sp. NAP1]